MCVSDLNAVHLDLDMPGAVQICELHLIGGPQVSNSTESRRSLGAGGFLAILANREANHDRLTAYRT